MDDCKNPNVVEICNAYNRGWSVGSTSEAYLNPFTENGCEFKAYSIGYIEGLSARNPEEEIPAFLKRQAD